MAPARSSPPAAECGRHPGVRAVARCSVCRAPLCAECRAAFGYFCSGEHQAKAPRDETAQPGEYDSAREKARRQLKGAGLAAAGAALLAALYFAARGLIVTPGEIRWEADLPGESVTALAPGPDGVRAITAGGKLLAFDTEGRRGADRPLGANPGAAGFGAVLGDLGIVSQSGKVSAVSLRDGSVAWTCAGDAARATGQKLVRDGERLFLSVRVRPPKGVPVPHLVCLEARTGKEAWNVPFEEAARGSLMQAAGGLLAVRTIPPRPGESFEMAVPTMLTVFSASDGKRLWSTPPDVQVHSDPVIASRGIILATASGLRCYGAKDGALLWNSPIVRGAAPDGEGESGSRAIGNVWPMGEAVVLHIGQSLLSLGIADGRVRWTADAGMWISSWVEAGGVLVAAGQAQERMTRAMRDTRLVPDDPRLAALMGNDGPRGKAVVSFMAGFDLGTGQCRWGIPAGGTLLKVEEGVLVASRQTGMGLVSSGEARGMSSVALVDPSDGSIRWEYRHQGNILCPTLSGDSLVFATSRGKESRLVAVKVR